MVSPCGLKKLLPALLTLLLLASMIGSVLAEEKPVVVATTSVIGSVVKDLAGDRVDLYVIASPAICPAHHDIKPSDVYTFSKANLILYHGFEPWVKDLYEASGSKAKLFRVSGPWNTPDGIKSYYEKVASVLKDELGIEIKSKEDIPCISFHSSMVRASGKYNRYIEYVNEIRNALRKLGIST